MGERAVVGSGARRLRLRIAVAVRGPDDQPLVVRREFGAVDVVSDPHHRVGDLVLSGCRLLASSDASVGELRRIDRAVVYVAGRTKAADAAWPGDGVRHGDLVTIIAWADGVGSSSDAPALTDLLGRDRSAPTTWRLVERRPDGEIAGVTQLAPGATIVGRGVAADVRVHDPLVSRAHLRLEVGSTVVALDLSSTNGSSLGGGDLDGATRLDAGDRVQIGDTVLELAAGPTPDGHGDDVVARAGPDGSVVVDPVAVPAPPPGPTSFVVPEVPALPDRPSVPWGAVLVPLLMGLALVAMAGHVGGGGDAAGREGTAGGGFGGAWIWWSIAFLALGPIMSIAGYVEAVVARRRGVRRRRTYALAALAQVEDEAASARIGDLARRRAIHPSTRRQMDRARRPDTGLWSGVSTFDGSVRLGVSQVAALRFESADGQVWTADGRSEDPGRGGAGRGSTSDPEVVAAVDDLVARFAAHPSAPVAVPLWSMGEPREADLGAGLDSNQRRDASNHAGRGRTVAFVGPVATSVGSALAALLGLATSLPPSELAIALVTAAAESTGEWATLAWLGERVDVRVVDDVVDSGAVDDAVVAAGATLTARRRLVVIDGWSGLAHAVGRRDVDPSTAYLWVGPADAVPAGTATIVSVRAVPIGPPEGRVVDVDTGEVRSVDLDHVDPRAADTWAAALAPWRERLDRRGGQPPARVSLDDVHPEVVDGEAAVRSQWERADPSPSACLGRTGGTELTVDLRQDGPHMLVAGTTGAGKSELLQTLVASLAVRHPPTQVSMLLVDYKGGAAFGRCRELPHVVGLVTDLDDALARRALVSLGAEVRRREQLLAEHAVKDVTQLERVRPGDAPPALVVVIDEFASLVTEVPAFVDGVIDLARRGRSLGIHLVLATQRPAGVVNDHVLANTNLRVALRLADPHESHDLVGRPDAASIRRDQPGRALVRRGAGDVEIVQAAFGGLSCAPTRAGAVDPVIIRPLGLGASAPVPPEGNAAAGSQLDRLVEVVDAAARGTARPRRPWIDPLPVRLAAADLWPEPGDGRASLVLGVVDDPAGAEQRPLTFDLADGVVAVFGANAVTAEVVTAAITGLIRGRDPRAVRIDVIDGARGAFGALAGAPHVGSVIDPGDLERIRRVVQAGDLGAVERMLVVHDAVGLVEHLDRFDPMSLEALVTLARDGSDSGVHLVVCADRRAGLPPPLASTSARRVVMQLASADEECALGGDPALVGGVTHRGVVGGLAVQLGVLDPLGPRSLEALLADERDRWGHLSAPPIRTLPDRIELPTLLESAGRSVLAEPPSSLPSSSSRVRGWPVVPLGLDDSLDVVDVELGVGNLLIAGPPRSGRSTALATIGESSCGSSSQQVRRVLVAPRRPQHDQLLDGAPWDDVAFDVEGAALLRSSRARAGRGERVLVVVDDATDLDREVEEALADLVAASRHEQVRVVAAVESAAARRSYDGAIAALRRERRGLLLQPDVELDGDLVGHRLVRRVGRRPPVGRGEWVDRGVARLVQVAVPRASSLADVSV